MADLLDEVEGVAKRALESALTGVTTPSPEFAAAIKLPAAGPDWVDDVKGVADAVESVMAGVTPSPEFAAAIKSPDAGPHWVDEVKDLAKSAFDSVMAGVTPSPEFAAAIKSPESSGAASPRSAPLPRPGM